MTDTVLVVVAHPDDEVIGCGGTLFRHRQAGQRVVVLFLADGESSRRDMPDGARLSRMKQAEEAAVALGGLELRFLGLADNRLDQVAMLDLTQAVEAVVQEIAPTLVYTHHCGDLNVDHRAAHHAVLTACRPIPGAVTREIRCFEIPSSTEWAGYGIGPAFSPNVYVALDGDTMRAKRAALAAYRDEIRPAPHARSSRGLEALATLRGAQVGLSEAEAFMLLRAIRIEAP